MERYYLGSLFGATFYLHRFVAVDADKETHDHPWPAVSFVLAGSYREELLTGLCPDRGQLTRFRTVRWFNRITIRTFHRIASTEPETWTLFVRGKRCKGWGFLEEHTDIRSVSYIGLFGGGTPWWLQAPKGNEAGREALNAGRAPNE